MRLMKHFAIIFVISLVMSVFTINVFAVEYKTAMPSDMDVNKIKEEIASRINSAYSAELPRAITKNDIDLSKAFKYYGYNLVLDIPTNDFEELRRFLDDEGSISYEVPIYLGGSTFIACVARGNPVSSNAYQLLDDDEIAKLEAEVGKWKVHYVSFDEGIIVNPYNKAAELSGDHKNIPLLVGSIYGMAKRAVAIYPDEQGNIGKIVTIGAVGVKIAEQLEVEGINTDGNFTYIVVDFSRAREVFSSEALEGNGAVDDSGNSTSISTGDNDKENPAASNLNDADKDKHQTNVLITNNSALMVLIISAVVIASICGIIIKRRISKSKNA